MPKKEKILFRQLLDERGIKDLAGVQALVKELTSTFIQETMDAEPEEKLGYSKYDYKNNETDNCRNGSNKKTVSTFQDEIELDVPRYSGFFPSAPSARIALQGNTSNSLSAVIVQKRAKKSRPTSNPFYRIIGETEAKNHQNRAIRNS